LLLSVDDSGRPRAAVAAVTWDAAVASVHVGHRSLANAQARPLVTLLWPAPAGGRFALIVDGEALDVRVDPPSEPGSGSASDSGRRRRKAGGTITVRATSAILHVTAPPAP
jgi:hypothetical protein